MSQVDEPIPFPLRPTTSRGSQTDPVSSSSRFAATSTADMLHLPPLGPRPYQAASTPASVLPGVTAAAASAITSSLFASPEEEELGGGGLYGQTGLRRRSSTSSASKEDRQRPASAGSVGSASAHSSTQRSGTPDLGSQVGGSLARPASESPAISSAPSRVSVSLCTHRSVCMSFFCFCFVDLREWISNVGFAWIKRSGRWEELEDCESRN